MCLRPFSLKRAYSDVGMCPPQLRFLWKDDIELPCGKCVECVQQYSREWAFRCALEASCWPENCFVTLTYAVDPVSLVPEHLQRFLKRLRDKEKPRMIRFFACGEYGSKGMRPHYHLILFNYKPKDLIFFKRTKKGEKIYTSASLSKLWGNGFVSVGDVSLQSAKYCAKYMQKLNPLPPPSMTDGVVLHPAFTRMSNRPGIGFFAINPESVLTDKIYVNGQHMHIPRYFLKVLEREKNGYDMDLTWLKERRVERARHFAPTPEELQKKRDAAESTFGPLAY